MKINQFPEDNEVVYGRAFFVAGTHILMEKALEGIYECMIKGITSCKVRFDDAIYSEITRVILLDEWPAYLEQAFAPAPMETAKSAAYDGSLLFGEYEDTFTARSFESYLFYGEESDDDSKTCDKNSCPHSIRKTHGMWCMRCRIAQQVPARLMKKIRAVDRDYLKVFNPVKGGIKVSFSKDGVFPVIHISMSPKGYNPALGRKLGPVSDYLDTLSVQKISVKLLDSHIAYIKEQQRLAIESLEDQKHRALEYLKTKQI
jgi:hypothetical protein